MKKVCIILFIFVLLFVVLTEKRERPQSVSDDLIEFQMRIDNQINEAIKSSSYKIDNPFIVVNPYKISPLTAIMVFSSRDVMGVDIYINDSFYKSIRDVHFSIPLVNLIEDYNNKIDLKVSDLVYTYYIKTGKVSNIDVIMNKESSEKFLLSGTKGKHFMLNEEGKVIWYLDLDTQGFIEELDANTFLIGTEESVIENNVSSFTGIYEIDYLGKIRKRIDTKYHYHHAIKYIGDTRAFVLGSGDKPMDTVYLLNLENGAVEREVNIIDLLASGNNTLKDYLKNLEYGLGANSLDYLNGNIILSLRNINTIIEFNLETMSINFVLSNNKMIREVLGHYVIPLKYPLLGAHDVSYINDEKISIYNNGYDCTKEQKNSFSSGVVIDINKRHANIIQEYKKGDKYSYAFGSFEYKYDYALVNYAYMYEGEIVDPFTYDGYYSNVILYKGKNEEASIRVNDNIYKARVYSIDMDDRYVIHDYEYFNESIKNSKISIRNSDEFLELFNISNNSIELLMDTNLKSIEVILCGDECYIIPYWNTKTYFKVKEGIYSLYVSIDGKYFKYKKKILIG